MAKWEVVNADVLEWCREYDGPPFHAMLSDSPWELNFMSRKWDATGISFQPETWEALMRHLLPGAWMMVFAASRGWHRLACALEDGGAILQPSIFVEGVGLVDAPLCIGWAQGQSFPKASRIDAKLDAEAGIEREVIGRYIAPDGKTRSGGSNPNPMDWDKPSEERRFMLTAPATPLAAAWEGHRYGGQVIKDVLSPIVCAQKPWTGKRLDCIVETGAGALNVDAARIQAVNRPARISVVLDGEPCGPVFGKGLVSGTKTGLAVGQTNTGRWPSSLCLVHHPACVPITKPASCPACSGTGGTDGNGACEACGGSGVVEVGTIRKVKGTCRPYERGVLADSDKYGEGCGTKEAGYQTIGYGNEDGLEPTARYSCARYCAACDRLWTAEEVEPCECGQAGEWCCSVRLMGEQSGEREVSGTARLGKVNRAGNAVFGSCEKGHESTMPNDRGTAARFFLNPDFTLESIEDEFWADTAERLATGRPVFYTGKSSRRERDAGLEDFPLRGQNEVYGAGLNTATKCDPKLHTPEGVAMRPERHNDHCTVKPLSLDIWLAKLLLPPDLYAPRRLLVPFAGTGSEGIGALLAGWDEVVMIEQDTSYCALAEARTRFWHGWHERTGSSEPKRILAAACKAKCTTTLAQQVGIGL